MLNFKPPRQTNDIERLKQQARDAYIHLKALQLPYSCGHALTMEISAGYDKDYQRRFDAAKEAFDALRAVDPNCPPFP